MPPASRPADRPASRSANRPDEFVLAATQLFANRGYHGASIANIADELGLTNRLSCTISAARTRCMSGCWKG